jgi:hypothetical protein
MGKQLPWNNTVTGNTVLTVLYHQVIISLVEIMMIVLFCLNFPLFRPAGEGDSWHRGREGDTDL